MKFIASILCLYLFALCIQPALFPLVVKEKKLMACCKKDNRTAHKGCAGDEKDCCGKGLCNPLYGQCPVCAANAVISTKYLHLRNAYTFYISSEFFIKNDYAVGDYYADILRPPQSPC